MSDINDSSDFSKDYYYFIKDTINDYSKYLKQYKIIVSKYSKKLSLFQEKFGQPLLDLDKLKAKYKNFDITFMHEITSIVPNIIQLIMNNLNCAMTGLDNVILNLDKIINEKLNLEKCEEYEKEYEFAKINLNKNYQNIEKSKNNFMNKMSNIEDVIYKYYFNINKFQQPLVDINNIIYNNKGNNVNNNKGNNVNNNKGNNINNAKKEKEKDKDKNDNLMTKEQLMNNITEVKKIETQYFSCCNSDFDKAFNNISNKIKSKFSEKSLDLTNQLKKLIFDTTVILKNNFDGHLNEIIVMIEKVSDDNLNKKLQKIVNEAFQVNRDIPKPKPKYYKIQLLNEPKEINGKHNPKNHIISLEDGSDMMKYINEYPTLYTINTLYENFDLIEKEYKFNLKTELKKLQTKELSTKMLSYSKKGKAEIKNSGNILISKDEINKLKDLLNEHYNRVVFLQDLNTFRAKGYLSLPKDIFDLWLELFLLMAKIILRDKDYYTGKNLIILSQTYYFLTDNKNKIFMQNEVQKEEVFSNYMFWEGYIQSSIDREIIKTIKNEKKNGTLIKKTQKESDDFYGRVVFAQLVSIADNMINFNFDMKKIKEILMPIIKHYNLTEESINIIDDIIHKNSLRKSVLLNDEIKQFEGNQLYKNFKLFDSVKVNAIEEEPEEDNNDKEKIGDIFNIPDEGETKE